MKSTNHGTEKSLHSGYLRQGHLNNSLTYCYYSRLFHEILRNTVT